MTKTTAGKKSSSKTSNGSPATSKKTKSSGSSGGGKRAPSRYQRFVKAKTAELKTEHPDMSGADRREEVGRLWKIEKETPEEEEEEESASE